MSTLIKETQQYATLYCLAKSGCDIVPAYLFHSPDQVRSNTKQQNTVRLSVCLSYARFIAKI